ncbi:hypothetical protein [Ottowia thiooxydans]|uniref:hypothetical protein n=1 Tax=Ottowia thiooxydans TaxID=219182 RepID=UPI0012EC0355|nr:hypothetical protein [Ottowia thiooxydans]
MNLANDWGVPNTFKVRSARSVVLGGMRDLTLYDFELKAPFGVIELLGSRAGALRTILLAVFSDDLLSNAATFRLSEEYAVGTLGLPISMFAAVNQLVSTNSAHFRISSNASLNAISTDASFCDGSVVE